MDASNPGLEEMNAAEINKEFGIDTHKSDAKAPLTLT